jgi:hypothetical protein
VGIGVMRNWLEREIRRNHLKQDLNRNISVANS